MSGLVEMQSEQSRGSGNAYTDGNPWKTFFGEPNGPVMVDTMEKYQYQRQDLPAAYSGNNLYIGETIHNMVMEGNTFYTSEILPYVKTDQLEVTWTKIEFGGGLADEVPYEGVARMLKQSSSSNSAQLLRRGLALELEHGFMSTPMGTENYVRQIRHIRDVVQETANHGVINALLSCQRYDKEWKKKHGQHNKPLRDVLREQSAMFGMVQKDPKGFEVLLSRYKMELKNFGVTPDSILMPSGSGIYTNMGAPPEMTDYSHAGPSGPARAKKEDVLTEIQGVRVYETRPFEIYEGEAPIDLLTRARQTGEYYLMADPTRSASNVHYESSMRDIVIFNEDSDQFEKLSFDDAIQHSFRFNDDGSLHDAHYDTFENGTVMPENVTDLFAFRRTDGTMSVTRWFGQMEKEYLSKRTIDKVVQTASTGIPQSILSGLEDGVTLLSELSALTTLPTLRDDGDLLTFGGDTAGFASFWGIKQVGKSDSAFSGRANALVRNAKALYQHLRARFPKSDALDGERLTKVFKDQLPRDEWGVAAMFENVVSRTVPMFNGKGEIESETYENIDELMKKAITAVHEKKYKPKLLESAVGKFASMSMKYKLIERFASGEFGEDEFRGLKKLTGDVAADKSVLVNEIGVSIGAKSSPRVEGWYITPFVHCDAFTTSDVWAPADVGTGYLTPSPSGTPVPIASSIGEVPFIATMLDVSAQHDDDFNVSHQSGWKKVTKQKSGLDDVLSIGALATQPSVYPTGDSSMDVQPSQMYYLATSTQMSSRYDETSYMTTLPKIIARVFLFTRVHADSLRSMNLHNITCPVNILVTRPMAEFSMASAVMMKRGRETGATYIGHSDFMLGDNPAQKMHFGHYTYNSTSVVSNNKNVIIAEDIFFRNYHAGYDMTFMSESDVEMINGVSASATTHIRDRGSILPLMVPYDETFSGPVDVRGFTDETDTESPDTYSTASYYRNRLGLGSISARNYIEDDVFQLPVDKPNTICLSGTMRFWHNGGFNGSVVSNSYIGQSYPGVAKVRSGAVKYWAQLNQEQTVV